MPPSAPHSAMVRLSGKEKLHKKAPVLSAKGDKGRTAHSAGGGKTDPKTKSLRHQLARAKLAAAARAEVIKKVLLAEDADNARVSRLLHDNIGQYVVALQLGLRGLEEKLHTEAVGKLALRSLRTLSESVAEDIHRVALELRPTSLADHGLARALQSFLEEWSLATDAAVDFDHAALGEKRLPRHLESTLFRAIRGILNVAKKAAVSKVRISLHREAHSVVALVEGDYLGERNFAQACAAETRFSEAAARISLLEGSLVFDQGRIVGIRIPISCES